MALSKHLSLLDNFKQSIAFPDAYIKVLEMQITKTTCILIYGIFRIKPELNKEHPVPLEQRSLEEPILQQNTIVFPLDLDGPNPIKQAYLHLKTLPEFADAIDC